MAMRVSAVPLSPSPYPPVSSRPQGEISSLLRRDPLVTGQQSRKLLRASPDAEDGETWHPPPVSGSPPRPAVGTVSRQSTPS